MVSSQRQSPSESGGAHLILYDGVCGLCNRLVGFVLRHDHRCVFDFAAHQSAVGRSMVERSGGDSGQLTSFYVIADYRSPNPSVFTRSDASLFVAGELGWPWKMARLLRFVPRAIRDRGYDLVARTRYRVFGQSDRCQTPPPEWRSRFIG
jgi:predicted DCC family thiol-disulfide oxidoreductase YuxK